jgi:hypothetical protein
MIRILKCYLEFLEDYVLQLVIKVMKNGLKLKMKKRFIKIMEIKMKKIIIKIVMKIIEILKIRIKMIIKNRIMIMIKIILIIEKIKKIKIMIHHLNYAFLV